jgi:prepilin-type N-terminal cleavage/methylation domain-containing protein
MKGLKNKKGFTLIELLMVIGIIGILVSIVIETVTKLT